MYDALVKSRKTPSPLMGEGRGEGENTAISSSYVPLPFIPSHEGRGSLTFYESINLDALVKSSIMPFSGIIMESNFY
ncbi:MAG: hypothetical protein J7J07_00615, partial [Syntrophobacterales bacterium]|nr:hypothetical protein [Syntrophobacterales bacterium]